MFLPNRSEFDFTTFNKVGSTHFSEHTNPKKLNLKNLFLYILLNICTKASDY